MLISTIINNHLCEIIIFWFCLVREIVETIRLAVVIPAENRMVRAGQLQVNQAVKLTEVSL